LPGKKSKDGGPPEPPFDPAAHEEFKREMRQMNAAAKLRVEDGIAKLAAAFEEHDPLHVIAELSFENCFIDPDTYHEPTDEHVEAYVEYAQSIALAVERPGTTVPATEWVDECAALVRTIVESTQAYFMTEFTQEGFEHKYPGVEAEVRVLTILRTLKMRGDSVQEHHEDLFMGLFAPHSDFLVSHFGFTASEFVRAQHAVHELVAGSIQDYYDGWASAFRSFVAQRDGVDEATSAELIREFFASALAEPHGEASRAARAALVERFVVEPSADIPTSVLDLLSAELGSNRDFLEGKAKGWPLGESVIRRKPLVRRAGKTYAFNPLLLSRVLIDSMESAIREADRSYFDDKFLPARARYLEAKVVEHLGALLPGAAVHRNLKYQIIEGGKPKLVETDALLIFDHYLFIVEAKAGGVTAAAHRGAMSRIKEHLESLIADAAKQGFRTHDYIAANSPAQFVAEDGSTVSIPNLSSFDDVFVLTPTLTPLAYFATRLRTILSLASLPPGRWPWSVFLNDLRVASEIFESPGEFVLYLRRRLLINDTADIATPDELDFVMFFLKEGMFFGDTPPAGFNPTVLDGYTVDLDRYYSFLGGRASSGEKPRFNIGDDMRAFVASIESSGLQHRTYAAAAFLALDSVTQRRVMRDLDGLRELVRKDGEEHTLTMSAGSVGYAISVVPPANADADLKRLRAYSRTKKHQWEKDGWVHLFILLGADGSERIDLFVDPRPHVPDRDLDGAVSRFQRQKVAQARARGKIGRNDPCPCNSGKKFKKCCGA
jgi:hypothetical protein